MRSWLVLVLSAGFMFAISACSTDSNSSNGALEATGGGGAPDDGGASGGRATTGGSKPTASGGGSPSSGGSSSRGGSPSSGGRGPGAGGLGSAGTAGEPQAGRGSSGEPASAANCSGSGFDPGGFDTVYEVGPGLDYETPSDVPWESVGAGSLVRVHYRAEPYRDKWVINSTGTGSSPIVVLGVPDDGRLPVVSGAGAATRSALDYWNEERGIIKIGGANVPEGPAASVAILCLDIRDARPGIEFTASDGSTQEYAQNAACVYLEEGTDIHVVASEIHGCGNGIFSSSGTSDVQIAQNHVYDNGNPGSAYEHNSYTESLGITFEANHYGPLCDGCDGNNLKDRSAGTVIRYNWIEAGNRQLDLVETDHDEFVADPRYAKTWVYGNILVEPDGAGNSQILHYGGDGDDPGRYRKGTLYFYGNTVVSTRNGNTTLFRLSTSEESALVSNNAISVSANASSLAIFSGEGQIELASNWLPAGWVESHDDVTGSIDTSDNVEGADPGFSDVARQDFTPREGSPLIDGGAALPEVSRGEPLESQYVKHQSYEVRPASGALDIGAFERP
jgi:hypothetical protein